MAADTDQRSDRMRSDRDLPLDREAVPLRLEQLLDRAERRGLGGLDDGDLALLGRLYRAAATELAVLRTRGGSTRRLRELNALVARGHGFVYAGTRTPVRPLRSLWRQVLLFPETVRRTGRFHLVSAALLLLGGFYGFSGALAEPDWSYDFVMPGDVRTPYATREELLEVLHTGRDGEVSSAEHAQFGAMLWENNTRVSLLCFFLGFLAAVPTAYLLLYNGMLLGTYTAVHHAKGLGIEWWAWILPHGVTELLAIVLLAGGGLCIGWTLIAPGGKTRGEALRILRPDLARLALGAFPMLLLAAALESFVRQSPLGDGARYVIASATAAAWTAYLGFVRAGPETPAGDAARDAAPLDLRRAAPLPDLADLRASS